jgi:stearoyl-CoA desaturase (Delta-9 desaturase)
VQVLHVVVALAAGFVITQAAIFITTVWLHRGLAHRGLTVRAPTTFAFRWVIWLSTGMRPREWVAVHRRHHASSDTEDDPHSPIVLGYWKVQLTNAAMYRRAARDDVTVSKYAKDLPADRWDRVLFDKAFLGLGVGVFLFCLGFKLAVDQWWLGLIAAVFHAVLYLGLSGAINGIGHMWGGRPADGTSATNNQWLAWITAGEGLHNNHHAKATSARFALHRREIDPGWWLIKVLMGVRQVTIRHQPQPVLAKVPVSASR